MQPSISSSNITILKSEGIEISGLVLPEFDDILTRDALRFVAKLSQNFGARREALLARRTKVQDRIDQRSFPTFLSETEDIRRADWRIAPVPDDILDRRVEITGPAGDTKMVINALNSGANVYMADFEDAQSPTWENTIKGQINLRDAIRGTLHYESSEGKKYSLNTKTAVQFVRPRGWHLLEKHILIHGKPVSASLFDFGMYYFHNAAALQEKGKHPYFYLPKMENHLEARLWNDVFIFAQDELNIPRGTIKATVLIETLLAAFEMDEILYELREHSAGLNCGRWDYIFSFIKKFRSFPEFVLPDRSSVTMDKGFLAAYVALLIKTCHRRGAHAMGGMSAFIPVKNDPVRNEKAFEQVRQDKVREVRSGHDGTWVAHPGLVDVAREIFDAEMKTLNQLQVLREDIDIQQQDLLAVVAGSITEAGLRKNIDVGIQYIEAWLRGSGAVPLYDLMEDAATAEISRAQVWQWIHHGVTLETGQQVTSEFVKSAIQEELIKIRTNIGDERFASGKYRLASELFEHLVFSQHFPEFLTLPAYDYL